METREIIQQPDTANPTTQAKLRLVGAEAVAQSGVQQLSPQEGRSCRGRTIGEMLQGSLLGRPDPQLAVNAQIALQRSSRTL